MKTSSASLPVLVAGGGIGGVAVALALVRRGFSVKVLEKLFQRFGLSVYDVERVPIHGGSLRVHARKGGDGQRTLRLDQILKEEEALGLNTLSFQKSFAEEVSRTRKAILSLLKKLKQEGKRVVGYGAPAPKEGVS